MIKEIDPYLTYTKEVFEDNSVTSTGEEITETIDSDLFLMNGNPVSGIYCFYDKDNVPLYLGQSRNLRQRLKSHFGKHSEPTKHFIELIHSMKVMVFKVHKKFLNGTKTTTVNDEIKSIEEIEKELITDVMPAFNSCPQGTRAAYNYDSIRHELKNVGVLPKNERLNKIIKAIKIYKYDALSASKRNQNETRNKNTILKRGIKMEGSKKLYALRESAKLAVKHLEGQEVNEVIEGLLLSAKE